MMPIWGIIALISLGTVANTFKVVQKDSETGVRVLGLIIGALDVWAIITLLHLGSLV